MSREQARAFLTEGTRTGKLAVSRADGRPHVTPVWFVLEADQVVFTTWHTTVKARALARNGRAAMAVDDQTPPYSFVIVEGSVTISDDLEDLSSYATRIGGRYMGPENAEAFGRRNAVEGELLVKLKIEKMVATAGMAE